MECKPKERTAFFFTGFVYGGGERVTTDIARGLNGQGVNVELIFLYPEERYKRIPKDLPVRFLNARSLRAGISLLATYVRTHNVHTVFTTQEHAHIVSLLARRKTKKSFQTVLRFGLPPSKFLANMKSFKDRLILPVLARWLYPKADVVIGNSKHTSEELVKLGVPRGKVYTIHNPLRPGYKELIKATAPHDWLKNKTEPVVLGFGRLEPQKDFTTLIRAFAKLQEVVSSRLIILGEGSQRDKLLYLAQELGVSDRIDLPGGYIENPLAWMAHADVFVLSSKFEGFPNVLVEAIASGIPVIATECISGPREILAPATRREKHLANEIEKGEFGILVPIGDPRMLAQALREVLTDKILHSNYSNRSLVRSGDFDTAKIVKQYKRILLRK